jgi:hypothetical protein
MEAVRATLQMAQEIARREASQNKGNGPENCDEHP